MLSSRSDSKEPTDKKQSDSKSDSKDASGRKQQLEEFRKKQVSAQRRALQIVEQMLENPVSEDWLKSVCHFICKADYDDVVVERTCLKLCGYPLCTNKLLKISNQKYHICTKTNKVYDVSERKFFCSNKCYKASCFVKEQILISPLWLRDVEDEKTTITLLPLDNERGSPGEEVKFGTIHDDFEGEFTTSHIFKNDKSSEAAQKEILNHLDNDNKENHVEEVNNVAKSENDDHNHNIRRNQQVEVNVTEDNESFPANLKHERNDERIPVPSIECSSINKEASTSQRQSEVVPNDRRKSSENQVQKPHSCYTHPVGVAVKAIREWVTPDTLKVLSGNENFEAFLKEVYNSGQTEIVKNFNTDQQKILKMKLDYMKLCRKLDREEAADEELDAALIAEAAEEKVEGSRPHCDAEALDETMFEKKLSSFFQGKLSLSEVKIKEKKKTRTAGKRNSSKTVKKSVSSPMGRLSPVCQKDIRGSQVGKKKLSESTRDVSLPLIDAYAQDTLRKQIVLDKVKVIYPDILAPIGLSLKDISNDLLEVVTTFRLTPSTITFKPIEWMLLAVFLLKIMGCKCKFVTEALSSESSRRFMQELLQKVQLSQLQLDSLVASVLDHHSVLHRAVCT